MRQTVWNENDLPVLVILDSDAPKMRNSTGNAMSFYLTDFLPPESEYVIQRSNQINISEMCSDDGEDGP